MAWLDEFTDYGSLADQNTGDLYFDDWGGGSDLSGFDAGQLQDVPVDYNVDLANLSAFDPSQFTGPTQDTASSYWPEAFMQTSSASPQDFVGAQQPSMADVLMSKLYGAEGWAKQHSGLTSLGVGALSFLSSQNAARRAAKQQKKAYSSYLADKAARDAKSAQQNAAWVPTEFRTRNTAVTGPTVADRYGISGRGSSANNAPSNYDYFTKNYAQLAKGGLAHVRHQTGGQDDKVPAMLSGGEYVFDADAVSALGDGNNEAGALKLDKMRENLRAHKRAAPANKIPPKAKAPEAYLKKDK